MKSIMRSISNQLLNNCDINYSMDCSEDISEENGGSSCDKELDFMKKRSSTITLSIIKKWYYKTINAKSPNKKRKLTSGNVEQPPIVIIFQDLEGFIPKLLQDFILMTSFHTSSLPITLVLGVATTWPDLSQRLFPHSVLVNLSVKIFSTPPASAHLALLLDEVLLSWDYPFKLSGRCMQLLLDVFLCHDFSITNFLHILKFCILEHFYDKFCSILCTCDVEKATSILLKFNKNETNEMRKLPSVQRYLSSLNKEQHKEMKKESVFKDRMVCLLSDLHSFHSIYFSVLRSLHALTSALPQQPMGKQLREVYIACSKIDLTNYEGFKEAFTFLKVSSRDQLIARLTACVGHLTSSCQSDSNDDFSVNDAFQKISKAIADLTEIGQNVPPRESEEDESDDEEAIETVKYAYQLQERLRNRSKARRQKKMTRFEKVREETLTYLHSFYRIHLQKVQNLPLHEVHYFDSTNQIKRHLIAAPRLSIQTALSDPYQYLKIPSLQSVVDGVIPTNAPDVCVAYKLHNECGSLINLYDWMQAFHTIVTSSEHDTDSDAAEAEIDEVTQARFIRAVSELQLLGFIRPTKKKTDHVQRLTWSHV